MCGGIRGRNAVWYLVVCCVWFYQKITCIFDPIIYEEVEEPY